MEILQKEITIRANKKGLNLITQQIIENLTEITNFEYGILHLFLKHTSASLTINENFDNSVQYDLNKFCDKFTFKEAKNFTHVLEGQDDMPAHILASFIGTNIQIPISKGKLNLGTWQGIYLFEHREILPTRTIIATIFGKINR